jgi:spermidine synthase
MKPCEHLDTTTTPDGSTLELWRHDGEYVIRAPAGYDLMTSRQHGSEDSMMSLACPRPRPGARVLIGGLGMGYTLRATLDLLPPDGTAVVGELTPAIVEWNRGPLGPLAGHPLDDPRTQVVIGDVARVIRKGVQEFDAILLDVDNGPKAPSQRGNLWLYTPGGLAAAHRVLCPSGALAVWSVDNEAGFERQLRSAGFQPSTHFVTAHGKRGKRHIVFVGRRR